MRTIPTGLQQHDGGRAGRLSQAELACRWRMSERTIESWRWKKIGPRYLKIGGRVMYRLEDIEAFERAAMSEPQD